MSAKNQDQLMNTLTDPNTLLAGAGMATNLLGKAANPAQFALDYFGNELAMASEAKAGAKALGTTEVVAVQDSPFYKRFVSDMYANQPNETAMKSVASIAGAAAGGALAMRLGIPFGGLVGAFAGGTGAFMLADKYIGSRKADFSGFAGGLEAQSQSRALTGEQVFVATLLNHPDKSVIKNILKANGLKNSSELIEALDKDPQRITTMMRLHDDEIRNSLGVRVSQIRNTQTGHNLTASEMLATYYNSDEAVDLATGLKGANLLSSAHVGGAVLRVNGLIDAVEQQQMQALAAAQQQLSPQRDLPEKPRINSVQV